LPLGEKCAWVSICMCRASSAQDTMAASRRKEQEGGFEDGGGRVYDDEESGVGYTAVGAPNVCDAICFLESI
jgi:hypothetical protein